MLAVLAMTRAHKRISQRRGLAAAEKELRRQESYVPPMTRARKRMSQWRGLAAAGQEFRQLEYATDDTLKLSGDDLTPEQHSCADELASHVASILDAATTTSPRMTIGLKHDEDALRKVQALMDKVGGLPASGDWGWTLQENDFAVLVSKPCRVGGAKSGLAVHQDYELRPAGQPHADPPQGRSLSFLMVLGKEVEEKSGATYVYLNSRDLTIDKACPVKPTQHGGQNKKRTGTPPRRDCHVLNPKCVEADLKRKLGEDKKVILEGTRYSLFRFESAQWHGACNNLSDCDRPLLGWSYSSSDFDKVIQIVTR